MDEPDSSFMAKFKNTVTPKPRAARHFQDKKTTPTRSSHSFTSAQAKSDPRRSLQRDRGLSNKTDRSSKRTQKIIRSTSGLGIFSQEIEQKVQQKEALKQEIKQLKLELKHMDLETREVIKRQEELYTESSKLQRQTSRNQDGAATARKEIETLKKFMQKALEAVQKLNARRDVLAKRSDDERSLIECLQQITPNIKRDLLQTQVGWGVRAQREREMLRGEFMRSVKLRKQVVERLEKQREENAKFVKQIRRTVARP